MARAMSKLPIPPRPLYAKGGEANQPVPRPVPRNPPDKSQPRPSQSEGGAARPVFHGKITEIEIGIPSNRKTATEVSVDSGGAGTLVGVRLQPKLLKRLDKHRGGKTRPQAIRELLEKHLP